MDKAKQIIMGVYHMQLHLNHVHNSHTHTLNYRRYVKNSYIHLQSIENIHSHALKTHPHTKLSAL